MPHFQTWDSTYYDFSAAEESSQAHRASAHRQWKPSTIGDQEPPVDSFEFEATDTPAPSGPSIYEFAASQKEILTFAPLAEQSEPVLVDDHCSGDEHEIEYDVSAGV